MKITDLYSDISRVGEGGYSSVFGATEKSTNRAVVLKQIHPNYMRAFDADYSLGTLGRIEREIQVLSRVCNSHQVVTFLHHQLLLPDVAFFGDQIIKLESPEKEYHYLVFERLHSDLDQILINHSKIHSSGLALDTIKPLFFQLCKGLNSLKKESILHRDIKPANLLVDDRLQTLKIADFGFGRTFGVTFGDHSPYVGTTAYKAPEILLGSTSYGPEVDVWSAACVLAEMATGNMLFKREARGDEQKAQMMAIVRKLGSPMQELWPGATLSPEFEGIPPKTLDGDFSRLLGSDGVDLLSKMLTYVPSMRITPKQAMEHSFFDSVDKSIYGDDDDEDD